MNDLRPEGLLNLEVDPYLETVKNSVQNYRNLLGTAGITERRFKNSIVSNPVASDPQAKEAISETFIHHYGSYSMLALLMPGEQTIEDITFNLLRYFIVKVMLEVPIGAIDADVLLLASLDLLQQFIGENNVPENNVSIFTVAYNSAISEIYEGRTATTYPSGEEVPIIGEMLFAA
ncbi:MAG: hypothetical protein ACMG57_05505 [Candidatus Dojkabacteria bacterium]